MKLESVGILIDLRPFGECDVVARVFTMDFGILCGVMRGAQIAKKNIPLVGQIGDVAWNARLDTQLGTFHWEATKNLAAELMLDANKLAFMNAAFALINALLPEREKYDALYHETLDLLNGLVGDNAAGEYLRWENNLLRELGYALDLRRCSGCGSTDDLEYISPRTGRAVCKNCAAPYIDKLFCMPVNLTVTARFLERVCLAVGVDLPLARKMLSRIAN